MKAAAAAPILSASRREARGTAIDIDDWAFLEVREAGKLKPAAKPPTSCSANMMLCGAEGDTSFPGRILSGVESGMEEATSNKP